MARLTFKVSEKALLGPDLHSNVNRLVFPYVYVGLSKRKRVSNN
jgi:hypothetical protein